MNTEDFKKSLPLKRRKEEEKAYIKSSQNCVCSTALGLGPEMGSGFNCESYSLEVIISHLGFSSCHSRLQAVLFNVAKGELKCLLSSQLSTFYCPIPYLLLRRSVGFRSQSVRLLAVSIQCHAQLSRLTPLNLELKTWVF